MHNAGFTRPILSPVGREMLVALRHYADAAGRWMRREDRISACTAGRTRGDVLVIAAIGRCADEIEQTLLREGLLEGVQVDYDEHMLRVESPDFMKEPDHG